MTLAAPPEPIVVNGVTVSDYFPLIEQIANQRARASHGIVRPEELYSEGYLGLCHAARRFEPARGLKFNTLATHCIRGYMQMCIESSGRITKAELRNIRTHRRAMRRQIPLDALDPTDRKSFDGGERAYKDLAVRALSCISHPRRRYIFAEHALRDRTFKAIGRDMGISHQRAHQMFKEARAMVRERLKSA